MKLERSSAKMKSFKKFNHIFKIKDEFSINWFKNNLEYWEPSIFHVLEYYQNKKKDYLDIGSWIGGTAIIASKLFNKVYAIEPDPIAHNRLKDNITTNKKNNIIAIKECLSNKVGEIEFGGNGPLGNSESSMLVSNDDFLSFESRSKNFWKNKHHSKVLVKTLDFKGLIKKYKINLKNVSLVKIDIEGGEKIIIPHINKFLSMYLPVVYLELHHMYLRKSEIEMILDRLLNIYKKCYFFNSKGKKFEINKDLIVSENISHIIFE